MRSEPSLRLPVLTEASDLDRLSYLSNEEKQLGIQFVEGVVLGATDHEALPDHAALKDREPMFISAYDPALTMGPMGAAYTLVAQTVTGLTNAEIAAAIGRPEGLVTEDLQRRRQWELSMLFVYKLAWDLNDEWLMRLMATMPRLFGTEKSVMLGTPQSNVWDDDERLVLEFTGAVVNRNVSDELYARADAAWGTQGIIRRVTWIALYHYYTLLGNVNTTDAYKRGEVPRVAGHRQP